MATPHNTPAASEGMLHDCAAAIMERAGAHLSDLDNGQRFHVTMTAPRLVHIDRHLGEPDGDSATALVGTIALDDTRPLDDVNSDHVHAGTDMAGKALPVSADASVESVVAAAMALAVDMVNTHLKTLGVDASVGPWNPQGGATGNGGDAGGMAGDGSDTLVDDGDA